MKKLSIYLVLISLLAISSCKKSSSPMSIVGKWNFSNITGTTTNNYSSTSGNTVTYSYNSAINTITASTVTTSGSTTTTVTNTISATTEAWAFNSDGTYSINEVYTQAPASAVTETSSGTWDYISNTTANDGFIFNGQQSAVFNTLSIGGGIYTVKSVGSTMVLTLISAQSDNTGYNSSTNITITFTKA